MGPICQLVPPLSPVSGDNIYEVMPSPVLLVSPISDTRSINPAQVSPIPNLSPEANANRRLPSELAMVLWATLTPSLGISTLYILFPVFKNPKEKRLEGNSTTEAAFVSGVWRLVGGFYLLFFYTCLCFLH